MKPEKYGEMPVEYEMTEEDEMQTEEDYRKMKAAQAVLAEKIAEEGAGAGVKWNYCAMAAMAGNPEAKAVCTELLGHDAEQVDLWNIMWGAHQCMTRGEMNTVYEKCEHDLSVGRGSNEDAAPYLANRLAALRKAAGLTQKELAARAGMPVVTLQKLENGVNSVLRARTETTAALAKALGITIEELIER